MAITSAEELAHGIELAGKERQHHVEVVDEKGGKVGVVYSSFHPWKVILSDYGENGPADQSADDETQGRSNRLRNLLSSEAIISDTITTATKMIAKPTMLAWLGLWSQVDSQSATDP